MSDPKAGEPIAQPQYAPAPARHTLAVPTYLENWPQELQELSISQVDIPLTRDEAIALGSNILEFGEQFQPYPMSLDSVYTKLEDAFKRLPGPVFVRLGSRSPKDAVYWEKDTLAVSTPKEAIQLLTAGSERMYEDLQLGLTYDYNPHIFLRQWIKLEDWVEFRCFMKNRKLVGISQYYHRKRYPEIVDEWDTIQWAIETFFNSFFRTASHLDDVVFDVYMVRLGGGRSYNSCNCASSPWTSWRVRLLEINPYWNLTDPAMFTWPELDALAAAGKSEFRYVNKTEDLLSKRIRTEDACQLKP